MFTIIDIVLFILGQFLTDTVIVAVPFFFVVAVPSLVISITDGFEELYSSCFPLFTVAPISNIIGNSIVF